MSRQRLLRLGFIICILILFTRCGEQSKDSDQETYQKPVIDSVLLTSISDKIKNQQYPNIHSLLISKNGTLIYEAYFSGTDQNYGEDLGRINFTDSTMHDLRSVSKSVVSACVGIAIKKGLIKSENEKIAGFFPEYAELFTEEKADWTLRDFLTMTTGMEWNEDVPYDDPENDEIKFSLSDDPVYYILNKPLDAKPGEKFNYNGGATQILGEIISRTSKSTLEEFTNQNLFKPLGIKKYEWTKLSKWNDSPKANVAAAASGLRLIPGDIMKFGLLYRPESEHNIISAQWKETSLSWLVNYPSDFGDFDDGYGYQFWLWKDLLDDQEQTVIAAVGNGGQHIFFDFNNDHIVIITAGNYNGVVENDSYALYKNEIYKALK